LRDLNLTQELRKTLSEPELYIKDIDSDTDKIIILFTIENLRYLSQFQFWLADGTFKSCPGLFKQIYTIYRNIKKGNGTICVPLAFSLMVKQTENAYRTMFLELNNFALQHIYTRNYNSEIITDFEKAAINAINDVRNHLSLDLFFSFLTKYNIPTYSKRRFGNKIHRRFQFQSTLSPSFSIGISLYNKGINLSFMFLYFYIG